MSKKNKTPKKEAIKEVEAEQPEKKIKLNSEQRHIVIYLLILLFAYIPTYNHVFDKKIAFLGDNAAYYIFGKALAHGDGYVNAYIKDTPPVNSYPPGYPAVISVVMKTFGEDITTIKKANGVLFFLSLVILFFFFRQISQNIHLSFALTLVMIFNYYLLQYSTWIMSEIPFIFFSSLVFLALSQLDFKRNPLKEYWFYISLFGMLTAYYIRSQGIALFGGIFLFYLLQRNWKYLVATSLGFITLIIPWYIRGSKLGESPYQTALRYKNYYDHSKGEMEGIGDWIDRFTENFSRYMSSEIPAAVFGGQPNYESGSMIAGFLILAIVGFGIFKAKKLQIAVAGYILATFAILMIWPTVWTGVRFMLPLVPFLILFFFYGLYELISLVLRKMKSSETVINKYIAYAFLLAALVYTPRLEVLNKQARKPMDRVFYTYFELAKWTKKNLPEDAIILCRKPKLFYMYSDHFVNGIIKRSDPEEVLEIMRKQKYTHIVLYGDGLSQRYFVPLYNKYPYKFPVIQKVGNPPVYLLAIKPDAEN
jgi:hypothetical protein